MVSSPSIIAALAAVPLAFAQSSLIASQASSAFASLAASSSALASAPRSSVSSQATASLLSQSATATAVHPSGTSTTTVQTVAVGQNGLTFTPDTIIAPIGSQITFQFFPKNHAVVQAAFNNPCNPLQGGIFSGFIATANGSASQMFTVTVQNNDPIWLYCPQNQPRPHCAASMVAVINPPAQGPNNLAAFRNAAAAKNQTGVAPSSGPSGGTLSSGGNSSAGSSGSSTGPNQPGATGGAMGVKGKVGVVGGVIAAFAVFAM